MKKSRIMLAIGSIALAGAVTLPTAMALPAMPGSNGPMFQAYDLNNNGSLDRNEYTRMRNDMTANSAQGDASAFPDFAAVDTDRNGRISHEELMQIRPGMALRGAGQRGAGMQPGMMAGQRGGMARAQPAFADMDANQDGYLTQDELDTFRQNRIKQRADAGGQLRNVGKNSQSGLLQKYDADKDGRLSEAEFNQFRADRMGQRSGMRGKQGKMGQMRGTPVTFADLDLNKDGKITPAEARQAQQQRMNARMQVNAEQREQRQNAWFQFLDSNKDGSISQSEFDAMQQQRRGPAR